MKNGKPVFLADARIAGKGERRFFATRVEAETWARQQRIMRDNEGASVFDNAELREHGWTIADAVRFALDHLRTQRGSVPVADAVKELIAAKAAAGRSPRYCDDLRLRLAKLIQHFGKWTLGEITTGDLERFLSSLKCAAETRNTYRRDCRTLWSFGEKRGWASANVAARTERARAIGRPPGILQPEQAAALLVESHDLDLRAFHAIGLFAGLRVAEIKKLDWRYVDLAGGFIEVPAATSKTRSRRLVPILDALRAWIEPVASTSGPVVGRNHRRRTELARRKAAGSSTGRTTRCGIHSCHIDWQQLATLHGQALESGHDQAVLFEHYRELVRPKDVERYWSIRPESDSA